MGRCGGQDWRNRGESGSLWKAAAHIFIMRPDRLSLREEGKWIRAAGRAENWEKEIRLRRFRPETFLRKITLIEKLGEEDEDQLYP